MSSNNGLAKLVHWYDKNCDGDWEHQNGFELMTLDNPGFLFRFMLFSAVHSIDSSIEENRYPKQAEEGDEKIAFWWEPEKSELRVFAEVEYLDKAIDIVLERLA